MAVQQCGPSSIYGPIDQTLFLGISVLSFSASVGLNEQISQCTVKLAEDVCTSVAGKIYWDSDLIQQTTYDIDDGFYGETRWERLDGTQYSGQQAEDSDVSVRDAIELNGLPVYFRIGDFEYSGLIQNWYKDGTDKTYTVILIDPRQLLDGSKLIIGDYGGSVGDTYNLFNVYGYMEAFGSYCPQLYYNGTAYVGGDNGVDGATFGASSGGFGGADVNHNGMQFSKIMTALNMMCNASPKSTDQWSPYGRIIFAGVNGGGAGLLGWDLYSISDGHLSEYLLDLSELPTPPTYWRLNSNDVSILEFISQLCEDAGRDYYIELIPVRGVSSAVALSGIAKIIKIRTISRVTQPNLTAIQTFVDNAIGVSESSFGRELRNDTLNAFVVGGPKQVTYQAYQHLDPELDNILSLTPYIETGVLSQLGTTIAYGEAEIDDLILPYFGTYSNGDVIMPVRDNNNQWVFEAPIDDLNNELAILDITNPEETPNNRLTITEMELQAALVSQDSLLTVMQTLNTDLYKAIKQNTTVIEDLDAIWDTSYIFDAVNEGAQLAARDIINPRPGQAIVHYSTEGQASEDLRRIGNWLNIYASEYYGRRYQVRVPHTAIDVDSESSQCLSSEQPSDGSWTDYSNVIGLDNPGAVLNFFRLPDNRIGNFARFYNASGVSAGNGASVTARDVGFCGTFIDTSSFDKNDYGIWDNKLYIKCNVEDEFVYFDKSSHASPRVVIEFPNTIKRVDVGGQHSEYTRLIFNLIGIAANNEEELAKGQDALSKSVSGVGGTTVEAELARSCDMPEAVAVGIKSNTLTYGPWVSGGKPGKVRVEVDEGLVPWEYGSTTTLALAGQSKADEGLTNMQVGEIGKLTVPGYPLVSLGAELNSTPSLVESRSLDNDSINETHAVTGPVVVLYNFLNTTASVGDNGPNVTDLTVEMSANGIQTSYAMSTYTPRSGRFAKGNAQRLKDMGRLRISQERRLRHAMLNRVGKAAYRQTKISNRNINPSINLVAHTPSEVLIGSVVPIMTCGDHANLRRSLITVTPMAEVPNEFQDYEHKAFMSLDGLIRPISMDGEGGLPQYATPIDASQKTTSVGSHPPIRKSGTLENLYNLVIDIDYLNPFSNPTGVGITLTNRTGIGDRANDYTGHDIDIVGRGTTVPDFGMIMPVAGFDGLGGADYTEDYRMLGLRGPMLLQSWGYDLNGKPIPNYADNEVDASGGIFANTNLHDKFMDQWLKKSHTWPVAPVDLRFDRARGVWVSPPAHRLLTIDLADDLNEFSSTSGIIVTDEPLYDSTGLPLVGRPNIMINDVVGTSLSSGTRILAQYDPYNGQYYPMIAGSGSSSIEWGHLSGTLSPGGTQTVNIWTGGPTTGDLTLSDRSVTAGAPVLMNSSSLSGWVLLNKINGYWWVVGAPC